jgi:hypothetical protein
MEARTSRLESFPAENPPDGRPVVRDRPQGTRILAYVENGKITRYEAADSSGNSRPVFLMKQSQATQSMALTSRFPASGTGSASSTTS